MPTYTYAKPTTDMPLIIICSCVTYSRRVVPYSGLEHKVPNLPMHQTLVRIRHTAHVVVVQTHIMFVWSISSLAEYHKPNMPMLHGTMGKAAVRNLGPWCLCARNKIDLYHITTNFLYIVTHTNKSNCVSCSQVSGHRIALTLTILILKKQPQKEKNGDDNFQGHLSELQYAV